VSVAKAGLIVNIMIMSVMLHDVMCSMKFRVDIHS
jgi:hypothetical protein